jgi:hypothetical protein
MVDQVSGSTAGELVLSQLAIGGSAGHAGVGMVARGGNASARLNAENPGGGSLSVYNEARGGGEDHFRGGGGDALVAVDAIDRFGKTLTIQSDALAKQSFDGPGGRAIIEHLIGTSTAGGDVTVSGRAYGGDGLEGAPVELLNSVRGDTTGNLTLKQQAHGGWSTSTSAGRAVSNLESVGSYASLRLEAGAQGGSGITRSSPQRVDGTEGATGSVRVEASNDAGSVNIANSASGGEGGYGIEFGVDGRNGGSASGNAIGRSQGDGHAVSIGEASPFFFTSSGAFGGSGGRAEGGGRGGNGGAADHESSALASGNSTVLATSNARGGDGGSSVLVPGIGGAGGDAVSRARAQGGGTAKVSATASAIGGRGGSGATSGSQGLASSTAHAIGLGEVSAQAQVQRGAARDSLAEAMGNVAMGFVSSRISLTGESDTLFTARADVAPTPAVPPFPFPRPPALNPATTTSGSLVPLRTEVTRALTGMEPAIAPDRVLSIGSFGVSSALTYMGDLEFKIADELIPSEKILLAFGDPVPDDFSLMEFRLYAEESLVLEEKFYSPTEAVSFFSDRRLVLDRTTTQDGYFDLRAVLGMEMSDLAGGFQLSFLLTSEAPEARLPVLWLVLATAVAIRRSASRLVSASDESRAGPRCGV